MFREFSQKAIECNIAEIAPGVALAVLTLKMGDFTTPDGRLEKDMRDRMSYILLKRPNGSWLLRIAHNTTIHPLAAKHNPIKC